MLRKKPPYKDQVQRLIPIRPLLRAEGLHRSGEPLAVHREPGAWLEPERLQPRLGEAGFVPFSATAGWCTPCSARWGALLRVDDPAGGGGEWHGRTCRRISG
jgi:hypothetical protein